MEKFYCQSQDEWLFTIENWFKDRVDRGGVRRVFLPAGETPKPLYEHWQTCSPDYIKGLKFVQVDDVISGPGARIFQKFFTEQLSLYIDQFEFIEEAELGADIALLGLGLNGHIAFHEPGLPNHFYSGCLILDAKTSSHLGLPGDTRAVTYGAGAFLKARSIALIVRGESKQEVLQKFLQGDPSLPVTALLGHPDLSLICC
jgi:6-phosphogluconolactonase/glucosamine-6-phosphate isomerase/deaminase